MSSEEKQLLFGEYAAGTISAADKRKLMAAALTDQDLFDAISDQEELNELMEPEEREMPLLLAAAAPAPMRGGAPAAAPMPPPPKKNWWPVYAAGATVAALTVGYFAVQPKPEQTQNEPVLVAQAPPMAKAPEPLREAPKVARREQVAISKPAPKPIETKRDEKEVEFRAATPSKASADAMPMASAGAGPAQAESLSSRDMAVGAARKRAAPAAALAAPAYELRDANGAIATALAGEPYFLRITPTVTGSLELYDATHSQVLTRIDAVAGQPFDIPLRSERGPLALHLRLGTTVLLRINLEIR